LCFQKIRIVFLFFVIFLLFECRPSTVLLSPIPDQVETIQGFAALKINGSEGFSKSRFSFLFNIPDQSKIEVFDFLGRTIYQIIVKGNKAFLVVPSKKIYCQSTEKDIIEQFIGSRLSIEEVMSFLSGQWSLMKEKEIKGDSWIIKRDSEGKVVQGAKHDMSFQVNEYIDDTPLIQSLEFENRFQKGELKVLSIDFNSPIRENLFSLSFMKNFKEKSWDEMYKIIENEG
jgi:outer membrane biogenesis lipoprotein LolB